MQLVSSRLVLGVRLGSCSLSAMAGGCGGVAGAIVPGSRDKVLTQAICGEPRRPFSLSRRGDNVRASAGRFRYASEGPSARILASALRRPSGNHRSGRVYRSPSSSSSLLSSSRSTTSSIHRRDYVSSTSTTAFSAASREHPSGPSSSSLPEYFFSRTSSHHSVPMRHVENASEVLKRRYTPRSDDPSVLSVPVRLVSESASAAALFRPLPLRTLAGSVKVHRQLAKSQLTFLIVLTSMAGYALVPSSLVAASSSSAVLTLLALTAGTTLCSTSANTLNQLVEGPYDAQMPRTRTRPMPSRAVTHLHAFGFAALSGLSGTAILALAVNPLTAALGGLNAALYAFAYTPMKRLSIVNTWVGAVVGAIPPLMGWTAATDSLLHLSTDAPAWILAAILFAWQFPHFNALSHNLSAQYARGGFRMMSVLDPSMNRRTALRYSILMIPLCALLPFVGQLLGETNASEHMAEDNRNVGRTQQVSTGAITHPAFAVLSQIPNLFLLRASWHFYRTPTEKTARLCFFTSLWHLPAVMVLAMACKGGLWESVGSWGGGLLGLNAGKDKAGQSGAIVEE